MELFRTGRKEQDEGGLPGERESGGERGAGVCANTSGVARALRGCRENASLLICCYFQLPALRDKFAWSTCQWKEFWQYAQVHENIHLNSVYCFVR